MNRKECWPSRHQPADEQGEVDPRHGRGHLDEEHDGFRHLSPCQQPVVEHQLVLESDVERAHRAEIEQRETAVAQQHDVAGVEVGVEKVVLVELALRTHENPPGDLLRHDVVLFPPGHDAQRVPFGHFQVVRHQHALDERHHQHVARAVPAERAGSVDLVSLERPAHLSDGSRFDPVIQLFPDHGLELGVHLQRTQVLQCREPVQEAQQDLDELQVPPEAGLGIGPAHLDRDQDPVPTKAGAMGLADGSGCDGFVGKLGEHLVDRLAEALLNGAARLLAGKGGGAVE